jgi:hypothetical protein
MGSGSRFAVVFSSFMFSEDADTVRVINIRVKMDSFFILPQCSIACLMKNFVWTITIKPSMDGAGNKIPAPKHQ